MQESTNNMEVRQTNRARLVDVLLKEGPKTKSDIVQSLNLSLMTVSTLLRELMEEGLVEQGESVSSRGGRRPVLYQIVAGAKKALGVCLSAHHIRITYVCWNLEIPKRKKEKILFENTRAYWNHFREYVLAFMEECGLTEQDILGLGISIQSEIIRDGNSLEAILPAGIFKDLDMNAVRALFPFPVRFFDDMKSAAFSYVGNRWENSSYVYLRLDHSVGGAVIHDGSFWGLSNRTGEFGKMLVGDGEAAGCTLDESCRGCRDRGCLFYFCSTKAITLHTGYTVQEFFTKLDEKDPVCTDYWAFFIKYLLIAIHNLEAVFDIDIIIGGELSPYIKQHEKELEGTLSEYYIYRQDRNFFDFSKDEEYDSAIGAGFLTVNEMD